MKTTICLVESIGSNKSMHIVNQWDSFGMEEIENPNDNRNGNLL